MVDIVFIAGIAVFVLSSTYFYLAGRNKGGLNAAFLVSFITLISYVVLWQGDFAVVTAAGEPVFWTRWAFYGVSCTLLIYEIALAKNIRGGELVQLLYLTVIVMFAGVLAARDLTAVRWAYIALSSVAYVLLVYKLLAVRTQRSGWIHTYVFFGWTVFPIVFLLAPTGVGLIGAVVANALYLVLDIYTKIVFNVQLASKA